MTSSNVSGWVSEAFQPTLLYAFCAVKPGVSVGTRMVEISFFSLPSAVVVVPVTAVTVTSLVMSVPELVMNSLLPLTTQLPSLSSARVRVPPASEPASGSVSPKPASAWPLASWGSHCCFCSSVPNRYTGMAPSETPASRVMATDWSTRAICSRARHSAK